MALRHTTLVDMTYDVYVTLAGDAGLRLSYYGTERAIIAGYGFTFREPTATLATKKSHIQAVVNGATPLCYHGQQRYHWQDTATYYHYCLSYGRHCCYVNALFTLPVRQRFKSICLRYVVIIVTSRIQKLVIISVIITLPRWRWFCHRLTGYQWLRRIEWRHDGPGHRRDG